MRLVTLGFRRASIYIWGAYLLRKLIVNYDIRNAVKLYVPLFGSPVSLISGLNVNETIDLQMQKKI
jgi:hypothetical protein